MVFWEQEKKDKTKNYKKKGAISICEHYIPNGSVEAVSKIIAQ